MNQRVFDAKFWEEESRTLGIDNFTSDKDPAQDSIKTISMGPCSNREQQTRDESTFVDENSQVIDELLTVDNPQNVEDLGASLFAMIDHLKKVIHSFAQQNDNNCRQRDRELADVANQERLAYAVENELNKTNLEFVKDHLEVQTMAVQLECQAKERSCQVELRRDEEEFSQWKSQEEKKIKEWREESDRRIAQAKEIVDGIAVWYKDIGDAVKPALWQATEKAFEQVSHESMSVGKISEYLRPEYLEQVRVFYYKIFEELKKIFFRQGLSQLCEVFGAMFGRASVAFNLLCEDQRTQGMKLLSEFEQQKIDKAAKIQEKDALRKREYERQRQRDSDSFCEEQRLADEKTREEEKRHQSELKNIHEEYDKKRNALEAQWNDILQRERDTFYAVMERVFPSAAMQVLYRCLDDMREHINKPYAVAEVPLHNIAIGDAAIPFLASGTVRYAASSEAIYQLMKEKYRFMFAAEDTVYQKLRIPYIVSVDCGMALLLKYSSIHESMIKQWVNGLGIRMLWSIPAGLQEFSLLDAEAIGAYSSLQFMDPAKYLGVSSDQVKSILIGGRVFQKKEDLARQIEEMRVRFESRKGSMGSYKVLRNFNTANFMSRETYQTAIIQHFPMNLSADSVMDITTLVRDCRTIGFSAVLAMPDNSSNYMDDLVKLRLQDLEAHSVVMQMDNEGFFKVVSFCKTNSEKEADIYLYSLPGNEQLEGMRKELFEATTKAHKVSIPFERVTPLFEERYVSSSASGISIPLGLMRGGGKFELRMDDVHIHTILHGVTRSGKTNLLHVLLTNTMLKYSPDEVSIYLIDFKHGVDFSVYSNYNLPNFRVLSITNEAEFPLAALDELEREFDRRAFDLNGVMNISDYNRLHPDRRMKRILLIIDELYVLTKDAGQQKEVVNRILQVIDKMAHMSGAFGIHMLVCGQDTTKVEGIENIITQCANRIVMHSSDADAQKILGNEQSATLMHEIKPSNQGACVYSDNYGETVNLAYTAKMLPEYLHEVLSEISTHYSELNRQTDVRVLLTEPSKSKYHPFSCFVDSGMLSDKEVLYIGEPITLLKEYSYFPDKNLWILGGSTDVAELAGHSTMFSSLLSLLLIKLKRRKNGKQMDILCVDGRDDGMGETDRNDRFYQFCNMLIEDGGSNSEKNQLLRYTSGDKIGQYIKEVTDVINKRRMKMAETYPVWLLISCVEQCYDVSEQDKMALSRMISEGPKYGVHTILWTKEPEWTAQLQLASSFCDKLILETLDVEKFGIRIRQNYAVGYKAQLIGGQSSKIRLYDLPVYPWLDKIAAAMNQCLVE